MIGQVAEFMWFIVVPAAALVVGSYALYVFLAHKWHFRRCGNCSSEVFRKTWNEHQKECWF